MGNDFYQDIEEINSENAQNIPLVGIGANCMIKNALIDKDVRIGNNVYINGGKHLQDVTTDLYSIKDGIVVVKKGVLLPDNFKIE